MPANGINRPCALKLFCPADPRGASEADDPIINYTSEQLDPIDYPGYTWPAPGPDTPLGGDDNNPFNPNVPTWYALGCVGLCRSLISLQDAQQCAANQAYICQHTGPGGAPPVSGNNPQSCPHEFEVCPSGVPPNTVVSVSQELADRVAQEYACDPNRRGTVVRNTAQSYTAHCVPEAGGDPVTRTVPADTFRTCVTPPASQQTIALAQAAVDAAALDQARQEAQAALDCNNVCNTRVAGIQKCQTNVNLVATAAIEAGTFCGPFGTDPQTVQNQAEAAMVNQLKADLNDMGCACAPSAAATGGQTPDMFFPCDSYFIPYRNGVVNGDPCIFPSHHLPPGTTITAASLINSIGSCAAAVHGDIWCLKFTDSSSSYFTGLEFCVTIP